MGALIPFAMPFLAQGDVVPAAAWLVLVVSGSG
jgi:hypothetical protein